MAHKGLFANDDDDEEGERNHKLEKTVTVN
jgi:hypothetical protein